MSLWGGVLVCVCVCWVHCCGGWTPTILPLHLSLKDWQDWKLYCFSLQYRHLQIRKYFLQPLHCLLITCSSGAYCSFKFAYTPQPFWRSNLKSTSRPCRAHYCMPFDLLMAWSGRLHTKNTGSCRIWPPAALCEPGQHTATAHTSVEHNRCQYFDCFHFFTLPSI